MQRTRLNEQITPYGVTFKNASGALKLRSKSMTPAELRALPMLGKEQQDKSESQMEQANVFEVAHDEDNTEEEEEEKAKTGHTEKEDADQREFVLKMSQSNAGQDLLQIKERILEDPEEYMRDLDGLVKNSASVTDFLHHDQSQSPPLQIALPADHKEPPAEEEEDSFLAGKFKPLSVSRAMVRPGGSAAA